MNVLALLKVIESYDEKSGIYFFCNKVKYTNKDNCDRKSLENCRSLNLSVTFILGPWKSRTIISGIHQVKDYDKGGKLR